MFSPTIIFLWLVAVPVAQIGSEQEAIDAVVESSRVLIPAKQIERTSPRYPQFELRQYQRGFGIHRNALQSQTIQIGGIRPS